jgi:hypothetical protein
VLPAGSVALAVNVCGPSPSPLLVCVSLVVHGLAAAPSRAQTTLEPGSEARNRKVGLGSLITPPTGLEMMTPGATVSTVHEVEAASPMLPALSTARTAKVCAPWPSPLYAVGLVQLPNAPPSLEHWNVTPGSESEKLNVASVLATRPDVLLPAMVGTGGATPSWV